MQAKDQISQLLIGNWAIIFQKTAAQLKFFRDPKGDLQGKFIGSKLKIENDASNGQVWPEYEISRFNYFQKFGAVYLSFCDGQYSYQTIIDKKDMKMMGQVREWSGNKEWPISGCKCLSALS